MAHEDDAANAPLIRQDYPGQETMGVSKLAEESRVSPGLFVWVLTFSAGISGLLFGYDTGVISSTLVSIGADLDRHLLTTLDKSLITACTSFFALLASPITGLLADKIGRRNTIVIADVLFIIGAVIQSLARGVFVMILGRSIIGMAVGGASFVVPLYISEISPSQLRGRLVTISSLFITCGQVVAYIVGWLFSGQLFGWRWMVGIGGAPALVQLCTMIVLPETPRYLVKASRTEEARRVLKRVYGVSENANDVVDAVLRNIEKEIIEEEEAVVECAAHNRTGSGAIRKGVSLFRELRDRCNELCGVPGNRRALTIACLLQGLQQLCGFNSLMYFSATIFTLVGFNSPTLTSLSIATTNFAFTLVAFVLIDRIGRRRILLLSIPVMIFGLLLCAVAFHYVPIPAERRAVDGDVPSAPERSRAWPMTIVFAMMIYVASYAVGLGNVPWQQSELFALSVRSVGSGIATATNWGSNFVVGLTFLGMMEYLSPSITFAVYAFVCIIGLAAVYEIYPETKGLGLEEVSGLLANGWGDETRRPHI